jgi:hypothetical protein
MEIKVFISLSKDAALALRKLADQEKRDPKQQASLIIEKELIRLKLMQPLLDTEARAQEDESDGKSSIY